MSFLTLLMTITVVIIVASMVTNLLKGFILAFSGLGIIYYLFFASIEMQNKLDKIAMSIEIPSSVSDIQSAVISSGAGAMIDEVLEEHSTTISDLKSKMNIK